MNLQNRSDIGAAALLDTILVCMQYPLRWIWSSSSKLGSIPNKVNGDLFKEALDILDFSINYRPFESAYTLASRKLIDLTIEGNLIKSREQLLMIFDMRHIIYLREIKTIEISKYPTSISKMIAKSVFIFDNRFYYQIGIRLIKAVMEFLTPFYKGLYELPNDWEFDNYSITEFRSVTSGLLAIAFIHNNARAYAIQQGVNENGLLDSLYLVSKEKLIEKITISSNVN